MQILLQTVVDCMQLRMSHVTEMLFQAFSMLQICARFCAFTKVRNLLSYKKPVNYNVDAACQTLC